MKATLRPKETKVHRAAMKILKRHYRDLDILIPHEALVMALQVDVNATFAMSERVAKVVYTSLERRGIVTEVGVYTNRRHLTEKGFQRWGANQ